jgi:hypothetical protein
MVVVGAQTLDKIEWNKSTLTIKGSFYLLKKTIAVVVVVVKLHLDACAKNKPTVYLLMNIFFIIFTFVESIEPSRLGKRWRSFLGLWIFSVEGLFIE